MAEPSASPAKPDTPAQLETKEQRSPHASHDQHGRLIQVLAWVGIAAGLLFIVSVIFFFGLVIGRGGGGYDDGHRGYREAHMERRGSMNGCPAMNSGGMMGPGHGGPGRPAPGSPVPTSPPRP